MSDLAASVRARLLNRARAANENFDLVLTRYGIERLLYRLVAAGHADRFVLKGAQLLHVYSGERYRPTRDLDLLGFGDPDPEGLAGVFRELCTLDVEPDGLAFDAASVTADAIRDADRYGGVRVRLTAPLAKARIRLQIDVGFGDAITPGPVPLTYPTLLDMPAPILSAYPLETIIAEKLESLVGLGLATSRMKDVYDLWRILATFDLDPDSVRTAIRRTFERRGTSPRGEPVLFTDVFWTDGSKQQQWRAFVRRADLDAPSLEEACREVARHLQPLLPIAGGGDALP